MSAPRIVYRFAVSPVEPDAVLALSARLGAAVAPSGYGLTVTAAHGVWNDAIEPAAVIELMVDTSTRYWRERAALARGAVIDGLAVAVPAARYVQQTISRVNMLELDLDAVRELTAATMAAAT